LQAVVAGLYFLTQLRIRRQGKLDMVSNEFRDGTGLGEDEFIDRPGARDFNKRTRFSCPDSGGTLGATAI
jgi:hypothetical protein